jgi:Rrf2 family protein
MEITRATEYAVRCILHLALEPPARVVPRREIAAAREIPEQFLGKIAQRLARAGIIRILQGARGGYQLALPADAVTLLAVVEAAEGDLMLNTCVMHAKTCSRTCVCAAHRVWAKARRQLRETLGGVSFAELAAQEGPLPLAGGAAPQPAAVAAPRHGGAERGPPAAKRAKASGGRRTPP